MTAAEEYRMLQEEKSVAMDFRDIKPRYRCGETRARAIVRSIRACCGGGKLPRGKVLASELAYWESLPIKEEVRI